MAKKVDQALVEAVKESLRKDEQEARIKEQLANITSSREMLEENENVSESERKMHLAKLNFNEAQLNISLKGEDSVKEMVDTLGKIDKKINRINLSTADGKGVIEIAIPEGDFGAFDEMMEASAKYWIELKTIVDPILEK